MLCVLPRLDPESGLLPEGIHQADWSEVVEHFGWNPRRRQLLDGLADAIESLARAGCRRIWLNGSFVTAKEEPGDFDGCWDPDGVDLEALDPVFLDFSDHRAAQKARFSGELLPNVVEADSGLAFVEFFQGERDASRKGIVEIRIGGE